MVIIVDDIHWCDANSLAIIRELIETLADVNITFVLSSRYEQDELKNLDAKKYKVLKIRKLDKKHIKELLCKHLNCKDVDKMFLDIVIKYTDGNPLYINEFIQKIRRTQSFAITEGVAAINPIEVISIPDNIQSLILANIAELNDKARNLLQAASVIGKEFRLSILCDLVGLNVEEVSDCLRLPIYMNIISLKTAYVASGVVEKEFMFNQDTEREAIYNNILNKYKRRYHKKIGDITETRYAKEIEDYYEILFTHYGKADQLKKAAYYAFKTALKYRNIFNMASALEYYRKFIKLSEEENDSENESRVLQAYQDMGYINFVMAYYDSALENLNKALKKAKLYDDIYSIRLMIADIYKEQDAYENALSILDDIEPKLKPENILYGKLLQMKCSIYRIMGNHEALNIARKSEKLLTKTRDYENFSEMMNQAGIIYFTKGDIRNSLLCLDKSYKCAEKINNLAIMSKVSGNVGAIYHATGMISKAQEYFDKCIYISKKISDQQGYIAGCINLGILYMDKGLFEQAETLFCQSLETSREIAARLNESILLTNLGDVMYERGSMNNALEYYDKSLGIVKEINVPVGEGINYISIARLYIEIERYEKVEGVLKAAYDKFVEADEIAYISDCYRYESSYELLTGNADNALELCKKAISISEEVKSDIRKLKGLRLKADILAGMEETDRAMELLGEAITLAHQLESDFEAAKGYFSRYGLNNRLGNYEAAQKDLSRAKECASNIDNCRFAEIVRNE